ncbi:MAG: HNH endonuclease [Archaeoglobaceae archaeon]
MGTWKNIRNLVLERDNYRCRVCGKNNASQVHHIIPKKEGRTEELSNLITLCGRCHMLLSPVPDWVVSKVWKIPLDKVNLERYRVRESYRKIIEEHQ